MLLSGNCSYPLGLGLVSCWFKPCAVQNALCIAAMVSSCVYAHWVTDPSRVQLESTHYATPATLLQVVDNLPHKIMVVDSPLGGFRPKKTLPLL